MKKPSDRNYSVGKGRTPVATRYKPGQSGNPKGRPKGLLSLDAAFDAFMRQKIPIKERGKIRYLFPPEIMIRQIAAKAMKGDLKAIMFLLDRTPETLKREPTRQIDSKKMTAHELAKMYSEMIKKPY